MNFLLENIICLRSPLIFREKCSFNSLQNVWALVSFPRVTRISLVLVLPLYVVVQTFAEVNLMNPSLPCEDTRLTIYLFFFFFVLLTAKAWFAVF